MVREKQVPRRAFSPVRNDIFIESSAASLRAVPFVLNQRYPCLWACGLEEQQALYFAQVFG